MTLMVSPSMESAVSENRIGERDFDEDDHGRAPAAEEQQDHHADQRRGQHRLADHAEHGGLDEHRLIAHGMQIEAGRQALLDARQQRLDARR